MEIEFDALAPLQRYKILASLVVPRPIALISTVGENGIVNAAPFSFFNALGEDPAIVIFSADSRASGAAKDTVRNALATRARGESGGRGDCGADAGCAVDVRRR